jgi:6-phosphogluconolactonase (cycloisomerase 2 family)
MMCGAHKKIREDIMNSSNTLGMTRREALIGAGAALLASPAFAQQSPGRPVYAYVGSFTSAERKARGNGVNVFRMDPATGAWTHIQTIGDLVNPSFLVLSKDQRALYSVHGDENHATAFAVDPESGKLKLLGRADTGGKNGVRQALDPSGKFLIVANYASGTVAVLPVAEDGALRDKSQLVELKGTPGPHRVRQTSSHPHDIVFDPSGRFVVVPDLGLDRTFVFRFDPAGGQLTEASFVDGRPTSGPRHVAFHPTRPIMWILNELDSTMTTCQWDGDRGALRPVQVITTLATGYTGNSTAAELAVSPSGAFVYASNRGGDDICVYAVDQATGALTAVEWVPSQGKGPRFIGLTPSGRFLYAANELGDTIATYRVDPTSGRLTPTGQVVQSATPVTIAFTGG